MTVALSGDGKTLVSGSLDGIIKVWDVGAGQERASLKGNTIPITSPILAAFKDGSFPITSVVLSGDGKTLVSARGPAVTIWDVGTGQEHATFYSGWATSLALSADGTTLVSGSEDGTVKVWVGGGSDRGKPAANLGPAKE
jgi:WD40 repeat protein